MIYIQTEAGEHLAIAHEIWVIRQKNGVLVRSPRRFGAGGISDGERTWSLGGLTGYPEARIITRAEYDAYLQENKEETA